MSAPQRPRDISKVARGEQAPRPVHEYGTVSKPPPPSSSSASSAQTNLDGNGDRRHGGKDEDSKVRNFFKRKLMFKYFSIFY